jgi:hypothetical protein
MKDEMYQLLKRKATGQQVLVNAETGHVIWERRVTLHMEVVPQLRAALVYPAFILPLAL